MEMKHSKQVKRDAQQVFRQFAWNLASSLKSPKPAKVKKPFARISSNKSKLTRGKNK